MWEEVCNKKDNTVKFRCTVEDCQGIISFALSRGINGEDCLIEGVAENPSLQRWDECH
jgi:hypothetical protein